MIMILCNVLLFSAVLVVVAMPFFLGYLLSRLFFRLGQTVISWISYMSILFFFLFAILTEVKGGGLVRLDNSMVVMLVFCAMVVSLYSLPLSKYVAKLAQKNKNKKG